MSDLFHEAVPEEFIRRVFEVMGEAHWHVFQILTKRSTRLAALGPRLPWPPNVWQGVSVENTRYTSRIAHLRQVPAAVRFLSVEPLLGPIPHMPLDGIHWVIVGGESGPHHRPIDPERVSQIRNQCLAAFQLTQATERDRGRGLARRIEVFTEGCNNPRGDLVGVLGLA